MNSVRIIVKKTRKVPIDIAETTVRLVSPTYSFQFKSAFLMDMELPGALSLSAEKGHYPL